MDEQTVPSSDFERNLSDRFQKRLTFDIARRSADFGNRNVGSRTLGIGVDIRFDLVGNVRDDLHRTAEIIAVTFLIQNRPVNFTRRQIGITVKIFIDKPFVMSEIEIGFGTVFGNKNFAVLQRTHRSGIDVDVGIEFLCGNFKPPRLEQSSE